MQGSFGAVGGVAMELRGSRTVIAQRIIEHQQSDRARTGETILAHDAVAGGSSQDRGALETGTQEVEDRVVLMLGIVEHTDEMCPGGGLAHGVSQIRNGLRRCVAGDGERLQCGHFEPYIGKLPFLTGKPFRSIIEVVLEHGVNSTVVSGQSQNAGSGRGKCR